MCVEATETEGLQVLTGTQLQSPTVSAERCTAVCLPSDAGMWEQVCVQRKTDGEEASVQRPATLTRPVRSTHSDLKVVALPLNWFDNA